MKKIFLMAGFLLSSLSASAVQFRIVCCDGSVKYVQGLSFQGLLQQGADPTEIEDYKAILAEDVCPNSCYATVDEMKSTSLSAAALPLVENIYVSVRPALYIVFNADGPSGSEPVPSQDEIL